VRLIDRMARTVLRAHGFAGFHVHTVEGPVHFMSAEGRGSRAPVLIIHGLGSCASDYLPLIRRLLPISRRLILVDIPGHGFSAVPESGMTPEALGQALGQALDEVLNEPTLIFGNSLGGLIAIRYAQRAPENVQGLVLASPGGAPMTAPEMRRLMSEFHLESHADAVAFMDRCLGEARWARHALAWGMRRRFSRPAIREFTSVISTEWLLNAEDLRTLEVPVALFWGLEDEVLDAKQREFFVRHLPTALVTTPATYGHAPFIDHPEEFALHIRGFLAALGGPLAQAG
jgi:pimeloyl-ACP methyl ester carboxylesterase